MARLTWVLAVAGLRNSRLAISWLDSPSATSASRPGPDAAGNLSPGAPAGAAEIWGTPPEN